MEKLVIKKVIVEQYRGIAAVAKALEVSDTHVRRFVDGKEKSENMKKKFRQHNVVVEG